MCIAKSILRGFALAMKAMAHSSCDTMRFVACQHLQVSKYCTSANSQWASNRIGNAPQSIAATRLPGVRIWERGGLRAPLLPKPGMVFPLLLGEKLPLKPVVCSLPVQAAASSVQIASAIFTLGTVFVLPVYTAMIFAPKWKWTKKIVESDLPFIVMSVMYIYLLALSWTPETAGCMFASKYLLPELPGITRMFSSTLAVASAWIHLLAVDLFCGRGVFLDGLQHKVETRHSLVLCLMMCPVGLISHFVTKVHLLLSPTLPYFTKVVLLIMHGQHVHIDFKPKIISNGIHFESLLVPRDLLDRTLELMNDDETCSMLMSHY